jgi:hypothetical protein
MRAVVLAMVMLVGAACSEASDPSASSTSTTSGTSTAASDTTATQDATTRADTADAGSSGTGTPTTGGASSETTGASDESSGTGGMRGQLHACDDELHACGNGIDDDTDGLVDLADPECLSPCDDAEDSFPSHLACDNFDQCHDVDCQFDGNCGSGDDECQDAWSCDPLEPGGCSEWGPQFCPIEQEPACLEACIPVVPNGCDCWGCCTLATDDGPIDVLVGEYGGDCSLQDLAACDPCTKQSDCANPCDADGCEVCFGQSEPSVGCRSPSCPVDQSPCTIADDGTDDCPGDQYCLTGCCRTAAF